MATEKTTAGDKPASAAKETKSRAKPTKAKKSPAKKTTSKKPPAKKPPAKNVPPPNKAEDSKSPYSGFDPDSFNHQGSNARGAQLIGRITDQIRAKWGGDAVLPLDRSPNADMKFLDWGVLELDWLTRGLAIGYITRVWGPPGSFKTTLCWNAIRQAQNTCRHCNSTIVRVGQKDGSVKADCECPPLRWELLDKDDYPWLSTEQTLIVHEGKLPDGCVPVKVKHEELGEVELPGLVCEAPYHMRFNKQGKPKKPPNPKTVIFGPASRCEPWRCVFLDTEGRISSYWAEMNGVDCKSVMLTSAASGERAFDQVETLIQNGAFDLIIIDSTSMLENEGNLEKGIDETNRVASHANLMQKFCKRLVAQYFSEGLLSRRPTILMTSQIRQGGIGGYMSRPHRMTTGGNALHHSLITDIQIINAQFTTNPDNTQTISANINFKVMKSQAGGMPGATNNFQFNLIPVDGRVGDARDLDCVMQYARQKKVGIVDAPGSGTKLVVESRHIEGGKKTFSRVADCRKYLYDNPTIYADIRKRVLASMR